MRATIGVGVWCLLVLASRAHAQDAALPTAAVLETSVSSPEDTTFARAVDRVVRERLDALDVVAVQSGVSLDIQQAQLALGCIGETPQCLGAVAEQVGATVLVMPSLDRADGELVLSVLLWDGRTSHVVRAVRRGPSQTIVLESVEGALRELFGLPAVVADAAPRPPPPPTQRRETQLSPLPWLVVGLGGATLIAGIVVGVLAESDAQGYASAQRPTTTAEADALLSRLSTAQAEATAANVLFVAGGVLLVGGLVWGLAAGNEDGSSPLAVAPLFDAEGRAVGALATLRGVTSW